MFFVAARRDLLMSLMDELVERKRRVAVLGASIGCMHKILSEGNIINAR